MSTPPDVRLRRGVPVVALGNGLLQVGVDPASRVLLPDTPTIASFVQELAAGTSTPEAPELREVIARLGGQGLLIDEVERRRRRQVRADSPVAVVGADPWRGDLDVLLREAGVALAQRRQGAEGGGPEAELTVLLAAGEPDRDLVDSLTHVGDPVLFVSVVDARVRVGPFVVPGVTACLRCIDAHVAVTHPWHTGVLTARRSGFPVDLPPLPMQVALARAAVDVCAWLEGRRPATWSATTWIDEDLAVEHQAWRRHPHCGCSWGDALVARAHAG